MKILDISAGNRAVWFDKNHRDAIYVDIRPEVRPSIIADARALPAEIGDGYDLIVFDPPHKNNAASGKMAVNYGHWTAEQIRDIVTGSAKEAPPRRQAGWPHGLQMERPHAQAFERLGVDIPVVGAAVRSWRVGTEAP